MERNNPKEKDRKPVLFPILGKLLIGLFLLISLFLTVPQLVGYPCYHVISPSMEPEIPTGSMVYAKRSSPFEVGDIIVFEDNGSIVTHRVVSIEENEIHTKGDQNQTEDLRPIAKENVIGKVVLVVPDLGEIASWISSTPGKIVLFGIGLFGVFLTTLG